MLPHIIVITSPMPAHESPSATRARDDAQRVGTGTSNSLVSQCVSQLADVTLRVS